MIKFLLLCLETIKSNKMKKLYSKNSNVNYKIILAFTTISLLVKRSWVVNKLSNQMFNLRFQEHQKRNFSD